MSGQETLPVLRWLTADDGFWVADADGSYAGTVDRQGGHHFVRNGYGEYIGDHSTLPAAQHALAAPAPTSAPGGCTDDTDRRRNPR